MLVNVLWFHGISFGRFLKRQVCPLLQLEKYASMWWNHIF